MAEQQVRQAYRRGQGLLCALRCALPYLPILNTYIIINVFSSAGTNSTAARYLLFGDQTSLQT